MRQCLEVLPVSLWIGFSSRSRLVIVEESYRNTLNKLILLFFLVNFVEWVMFMFFL